MEELLKAKSHHVSIGIEKIEAGIVLGTGIDDLWQNSVYKKEIP